jgi:hypothetical protein
LELTELHASSLWNGSYRLEKQQGKTVIVEVLRGFGLENRAILLADPCLAQGFPFLPKIVFAHIFESIVDEAGLFGIHHDAVALNNVREAPDGSRSAHAWGYRLLFEPFANSCEFDHWLPRDRSRRHVSLIRTK